MIKVNEELSKIVKLFKKEKELNKLIEILKQHDKSNYFGVSKHIGSLYTARSRFDIYAMVTYHAESDVSGGDSSFENNYELFYEQYINGKKLTEVQARQEYNSSRNVEGKTFSVDTYTDRTCYVHVNLF